MTSVLIVTPRYHNWPQALASHDALALPCPVARLSLAEGDTDANPYANITRKYERGRQMALDLGYDAMLCLEDDIIVPPDAIERLLACDADIAYGLVCWRHGTPVWSARVETSPPAPPLQRGEGGQGEGGTRLGRVLSELPERARAAWGKVIDVVGVGMACTLIRRRVLEALRFRLEVNHPVCCDWWLAKDAVRFGFSQRADLGLVCGHITPTPTPRVIWPDANEERLWRVERLM